MELEDNIFQIHNQILTTTYMKTCTKCNINKELTDFPKEKNGKNGLRSNCKSCHKIKMAKWREDNPEKYKQNTKRSYIRNKDKKKIQTDLWRKKNPDKVKQYEMNRIRDPIKQKIWDLKKHFGISLEEYNDMLTKQNNCCKICYRNQSEFQKALCVDHNHKTGKIRGLLCFPCNQAIGLLKDNMHTCFAAGEYLRRSNE